MGAFFRILLVLCVGLAVVGADEVRLKDGRVIDGTVTSPPMAETVDVQVGSGTMMAVLHFHRTEVAEIIRGRSARQERLAAIEAKAATAIASDDAAAIWTVALEFKEADEGIRYRELAREVGLRDRHHEAAHLALGLRRVRGIWMRPHEVMVAEGRVYHQGSWLAWEAYQAALQAAEESRRKRLEAQRQAEDDRRRRELAESPTATLAPGSVMEFDRAHYWDSSLARRLYWQSLAQPPVCVHPAPGPTGGISAYHQGSHSGWSFNWTW